MTSRDPFKPGQGGTPQSVEERSAASAEAMAAAAPATEPRIAPTQSGFGQPQPQAGQQNIYVQVPFAMEPPSFTGRAIWALILHSFGIVPGLIATIVFYLEGRKSEKRHQQSLAGVGLLRFMFWGWVLMPILAILAVLSVAGG